MKFQFPFENVLRHRKTLEEIAQREFQQALNVLSSERQILVDMLQQKAEARLEAYKKQVDGGTAAPALRQIDEFLKGQDIRIEKQNTKIQECEAQVEKLREILRQKAIDYKIIERLKERKKEQFKEEQKKIEQKRSDEMSTMRFGRHGR